MHSISAPSGTVYHMNGDFSGIIEFDPVLADAPIRFTEVATFERHVNETVTVGIPFKDMLFLAARYLMGKEISKLEQMTMEELLSRVHLR